MSYRGDLRHFYQTKDLFIAQGREFISERSGSTAKIIIEGRELRYFEKSNDLSIPTLCKMVIQDVKKFLKNNPNFDNLPNQKSIFFNISEIKRCLKTDVFGYDINACYWNIAKREGFISEKTYKIGLENKEARLIALGNLNKKVAKGNVENGVFSEEVFENPNGKIWYFIINEAYKMYLDIRNLVGKNFISWNTDCVYVSNEVDFLMEMYFKAKGLSIKKERIKLLEVKENEVLYYNYKKEKTSSWYLFIKK